MIISLFVCFVCRPDTTQCSHWQQFISPYIIKITLHWLLVGIPLFILLKIWPQKQYRKQRKSIHLTTNHNCILISKAQEDQWGVNWSCLFSYQINSPQHIIVHPGNIIYFSFHDYLLETAFTVSLLCIHPCSGTAWTVNIRH